MSGRRHALDPPPDPAPEYTEWIQHRYDPGYYLGGRIPPYLRRRPAKHGRHIGNRFGYVLIVFGLTTFVEMPMFVNDVDSPLPRAVAAMFLAAVGLAQIVGGVRLLRPTNRSSAGA